MPDTQAGRRIAGRYTLAGQLGWGAWFTVHDATDARTGSRVVVKLIHDFLLGDHRLARRLGVLLRRRVALAHPNLARVAATGTDHDGMWLVEERVTGRSLRAYLADGAIGPARGVRIFGMVARALAYGRRAGVPHGLVHPNAVRLDPGLAPKLTDLGFAHADIAMIGPRTMGTLGYHTRYLAPEVLAGGPVSVASEVYALGVLLGDCLGDCLGRDRPAGVEAIVQRATAPHPQDRPGNATAVADEVESVLRAEPDPRGVPRSGDCCGGRNQR